MGGGSNRSGHVGSREGERGPIPRPSRPEALGIAAILLFAALLRTAFLDSEGWTFDETYTREIVSQPLGSVFEGIEGTEGTPPVYYYLLWAWTQPFGTSEVALRALSTLFGTGVVLVAWLAARQLGSPRAALIAAALLAASPALVFQSLNARAYSLYTLFVAVAVLFLAMFLNTKRPRALAGWSVGSALAIATHYFAIFFVAAQAIWLLVVTRFRRATALAVCVPASMTVALLPLVLSQREARFEYIEHYTLGERIGTIERGLLASRVGHETEPIVVVLVLAALATLILRGASHRERQRASLAAGLAIGGVTLALLLAFRYTHGRSLLPALVLLATALAIALASRRAGRLGVAVAVVLVAAFTAAAIRSHSHEPLLRTDWRGATERLGPVQESRLIMVTNPPPEGRQLLHYVDRPRLVPAGDSARVHTVTTMEALDGPRAFCPLPERRDCSIPLAAPFVRTAAFERTDLFVQVFEAPRPLPVSIPSGVMAVLERPPAERRDPADRIRGA